MKRNPIMEKVRSTPEYKKAVEVMESDERAGHEYAENIVKQNTDKFDRNSMDLHQFSGYDLMESYIDGCRHKASELQPEIEAAEEKDYLFDLFKHKYGWQFRPITKDYKKETYTTVEIRTFAELYNSPAFIEYYEEMKAK